MSKQETKNLKELVLESLKGATTRGNFKVEETSFTIQADLQKRPTTIKGRVFAKIQVDDVSKQSILVNSDKAELEVLWNLQGRSIRGNNPLLDLVINL
jgi:hypothetical protein